jgi:Family of unknown function (DUF5906)
MMNFDKREVYNKLKDFLTTPPDRVEVNRKHIHPYAVPNIQNWIFLTNHDDAISLDDDDRRFWVHRCGPEEPPPKEYFDDLYAWYDAGGAAACVGYLRDRDISGFNPKA